MTNPSRNNLTEPEPHICGCEWHGGDTPVGDPDVECMYHATIRARVAELEAALRGVMSLGYIHGGMWKVAEVITQCDLVAARDALEGKTGE